MTGQFDPVLPANAPAHGIERRVAPRFPINLTTSCRLMAVVPARTLSVRVRNVSVSGISLVVSRPVDPGDRLEIELRSVARNVTRLLTVQVVYCIEHPSGELIVGGRFSEPLTHEEFRVFVR
jgi:hypothetical protein